MDLILRVSCNFPEYDGCSCAVVHLDRARTRQLLAWHRLWNHARREAEQLRSLTFWDTGACWIAGEDEDGQPLPDVINPPDHEDIHIVRRWPRFGGRMARLRTITDLEERFASRTECDQAHVDDRGVYWTAYPKHTAWGETLSTARIPVETLRAAARGE